jgi:uncharacterized membrane protein YoaK (UPF0700 family)
MHLRKMPVKASLASESSGRRLRSLRFAEERQERLAAGLAMIAGFLDAYGIITYNTCLSFMSGNTTPGCQTGQGHFGAAAPSPLAIIFFVSGSLAGALLAHSAVRRMGWVPGRRIIVGRGNTALGRVGFVVAHAGPVCACGVRSLRKHAI